MKGFIFFLSILSLNFFNSCGGKGGGSGVTPQAPWVGTKQFGIAGKGTSGLGITLDSLGNVYVSGGTEGGLEGNLMIGTENFFVTKYSSSGVKLQTWQRDYIIGKFYDGNVKSGISLACDSLGNVYGVGGTNVGVDGNKLIGKADFYVTKYNSLGVKQWTRQLGAGGAETFPHEITADSFGNIYIIGDTSGGLDGNTLIGTRDSFVTKYDSAGVKLWTRQLGSGYRIALDSSGNVFILSYSFLIKYNSSGIQQWAKLMGFTDYEPSLEGITIDSFGNIYVTGTTGRGLDGNTMSGDEDSIVIKFNSSGIKEWTRQMGTAGARTLGKLVTSDSAGNVFVAGQTGGGLDGNTLIGSWDFFVTKYNSSGAKQWTRQLGAAGAETYGMGISSDSFGNFYVTGGTSGGLDGNTLTGTSDFFITKFNSAGEKQ